MPNAGLTFPAEVFGDETLHKIFKTFPPSPTGVRNRALFMVYLRGQLRCNEALDLRICDVDFDSRTICIMQGKGGRRRVVSIDQETLDAIGEWLRIRCVDSLFLFSTHKGGRMNDSYVRKCFKRHAKKAGVRQRVHVHGCRHSGAVKLLKAGVPLNIIRKRLGHTSLAVTQRYIDHLTHDEENEYLEKVQW